MKHAWKMDVEKFITLALFLIAFILIEALLTGGGCED